MASVNQVTVIGNLGDDPDFRYTPGGSSVVNLSIATNRSWKPDRNSDEWETETIWWRASAWNEQAERIAEQLHKGDQVFVQGALKPLNIFTRRDGTPGCVPEIAARQVYKLGRRERDADDPEMDGQDGRVTSGREPVAAAAASSAEMDVDDIPF